MSCVLSPRTRVQFPVVAAAFQVEVDIESCSLMLLTIFEWQWESWARFFCLRAFGKATYQKLPGALLVGPPLPQTFWQVFIKLCKFKTTCITQPRQTNMLLGCRLLFIREGWNLIVVRFHQTGLVIAVGGICVDGKNMLHKRFSGAVFASFTGKLRYTYRLAALYLQAAHRNKILRTPLPLLQ